MQACEISDNIYACVSDDSFCRIWKDGVCVQEIQHPSSLWAISTNQLGDILTGGNDHVLRVFTTDNTRFASNDEIVFIFLYRMNFMKKLKDLKQSIYLLI